MALRCASLLSLMLSAAIFGFFYAWVCSTMWGLDAVDPVVAVETMQAMNASVRNAVFGPAFFGTGPSLILTSPIAWQAGAGGAAYAFGTGGIIYLVGGMGLTLAVNVPMNETLAGYVAEVESAAEVWADYSPRWQAWNVARTVASGAAVLMVGIGLMQLPGAPNLTAASRRARPGRT